MVDEPTIEKFSCHYYQKVMKIIEFNESEGIE